MNRRARQPFLRVFGYWKPAGVLSTTLPCKDGQNILESSPPLARFLADAACACPVVPIGRLDKASDGLLLLTTQPTICAILLRPGKDGSHISKEYHVTTSHRVKDDVIEKLQKGVKIKNRGNIITTLPCTVEREIKQDERGYDSSHVLKMVLHEGKNRQIRKMLGAFSQKVVKLTRVRFGCATLDGLREGEARLLTDSEVNSLLRQS